MCKDQHADFSGHYTSHWSKCATVEASRAEIRTGRNPTPFTRWAKQTQPQIFVSAELFLSDISLPSPFAVAAVQGFLWVDLLSQRHSPGQQQLHPGASWPWLSQTQGKLLAPPPTAKTMPLKPKHEQNNIQIIFIKDFPANII